MHASPITSTSKIKSNLDSHNSKLSLLHTLATHDLSARYKNTNPSVQVHTNLSYILCWHILLILTYADQDNNIVHEGVKAKHVKLCLA
jgi:hypothetical protein